MSRKIDALVAEHVMGWARIPNSKGRFMKWYGPLKKNKYPNPQPYSTDIAAAWQVVEKMGHIGLNWEPLVSSKWDCVFERTSTVAKTAPMAICLAALKAKGIQVDDE